MTISTEQFITVQVGASENDGTGDPLRNAFIKVNNNFANISDVGFNAANIRVNGSIEIENNNDGYLVLPAYTVASAPAGSPDGAVIFVSNGDAGNAALAVSVANVWYTVSLGNAISTGP